MSEEAMEKAEKAMEKAKEYTEKMRKSTLGEPWRIFKIMAEFVDSFEKMSKEGPSVTVFGSARTQPDEESYISAQKMGELLANNGYGTITGGGPGIMEAAHKGANEAGGRTIGLNIELPFEQTFNPYQSLGINFHYFFTRKVCFLKYSVAVIGYPGGFGTMDELFETLTLIQTNKINRIPTVLVGKDFWGPMQGWIKNTILEDKRISADDLDLYHIVDTAEEAMDIIIEAHKKGIPHTIVEV